MNGLTRGPLTVLGFLLASIALGGCSSTEKTGKPEYHRPLEPGAQALRKVDSAQVRTHLVTAFDAKDSGLSDALGESARWYAAPSSARRFPFATEEGSITHLHAQESVLAFQDVLGNSANGELFSREILKQFDVYQTVGWDDRGTVLFTGYYAPIFQGSLVRTDRFDHPLHTRPEWLLSTKDGIPFGRRLPDGRITDSPDRSEIESSGMLDGQELLWLETKLDAYICQVNGSACIELPDGRRMFVGYAGKTEHPYTGLGASMLSEGIMTKDGLSLDAIESYNQEHPDVVNRLIAKNRNYVFFKEYDGSGWPAGSLGVPVTQRSSIATDKSIYPPGAVALVDTHIVDGAGGKSEFIQLVCDQDTGGAIVAPGRCDLFMGIGPEARTLAGGQYAEGTMFYFFLKPRVLVGHTESRSN